MTYSQILVILVIFYINFRVFLIFKRKLYIKNLVKQEINPNPIKIILDKLQFENQIVYLL